MKPVRVALATLAATVVAAALAIASFTDSPSAAATTHTTKPTIVLVHGAWADSGSWDDVVSRLQHDGYTVAVPPNPLEGLDSDSQSVSNFLHTLTGPIVLVGHSYGGAVITNAATGDAQVKALVYVDAYIPDQGQTLKGLTGAGSCFAVSDLNSVFNFVPIPGAPAADPDVYGKADTFTHCFTNGLPAATANVLAATQRPLAARALTDPSGTPAWKTIPSWAVIGLNDHIIPAASQITMAEHAKSRITKVSAPHLSMLANPDAVTGVILEAAHSAS